MASAGTVTLELDANSQRLLRELQKSQRATRRAASRMQRDMQRSFRAIKRAAVAAGAALGGFAVGGLAVLGRQQLKLAGELQRVADTVGFTVEEVQKFRFAAEQLNISTRQVDMGLQRFSRRIGEVAQGTGELKKTAELYNVQLRKSDGTLRDSSAILADFADIVANTADEQEQLRIAFKLFDSEGASLVRLLKSGAAGMQEFFERAEQLGVVLDEQLINNAAEADRVLNEVKQTVDADMARAIAENAEAFARLGEAVGTLASWVIEKGAGIVDFFKTMGEIAGGASGFGAASDQIDSQIAELERRREELTAPRPKWSFFSFMETAGAAEAVRQQVDEIDAEIRRLEQLQLQVLEAPAGAPRALNETTDAAAPLATVLQDVSNNAEMTKLEFEAANMAIAAYSTASVDATIALANVAAEQKKVDKTTQELGFTFQSAFEDAIVEGKKLREVMQGLLKDILRIAVRRSITEPLGNLLGGIFSPIFGGGQAAGGPVVGGRTYLVGEKGPELLTMGAGTSGLVTPNRQLQARSGGVTNVYNFEAGADVATIRAEIIPLLERTRQVTLNDVAQLQREGRL